MAPVKTLGILTGGGDVPGLNPCIKAVVDRAVDDGMEVIGFRRGWAGPLNVNPDDPSEDWRWVMRLNKAVVRKIDRSGGTFLHTSRTRPSHVKPEDVPGFLKEQFTHARPPDRPARPDAAHPARHAASEDRRPDRDRRRRHVELRGPPAPGGLPRRRHPEDDGQRRLRHGLLHRLQHRGHPQRGLDHRPAHPRRLARAHRRRRAVRPQLGRDIALRGVPGGRRPRDHLGSARSTSRS